MFSPFLRKIFWVFGPIFQSLIFKIFVPARLRALLSAPVFQTYA